MSVPVNRGDPHLIQRRRSAKLGTVAEPAQIQFLSGLDMPSQADDPIAPDLLLVKLSQRFRLGEARQISLWTVSNAFGISMSSSSRRELRASVMQTRRLSWDWPGTVASGDESCGILPGPSSLIVPGDLLVTDRMCGNALNASCVAGQSR